MKIIGAVLFLFGSLSFARSPDSLTLEQAITMGLARNKAFTASEQKVVAARAKASEANTTLLPSLKIEGSYRRLSDVDPFAVTVPFSPTPIVISPVVLNNYSFRVTVQQPLFTGFKLASNADAAEHAAQASQFEHQSDRADLIYNITSAYWLVYQTGEVKKYVDENVQRLEAQSHDVKRFVDVGMATQNDLLKIQLQLATGRVQQIDAENDERVARMNLNNLIGRPLDDDVVIASNPATASRPDSAASAEMRTDELLRHAIGRRPDLLAMQSRIDAAEELVTAAKGGWWPQFFLSGNYYYSRPNPRYLPTRDEFKGTWDIGVVMQFDVWNWGATSDQTEQAEAQLEQAKNLFGQMRENVAVEVTRATLSLTQARRKIDVAESAIKQAEENVRTTNDKFTQGLATTSDLLDADVALLQARANLTGAHVEFALAQARLEKAIGSMNDTRPLEDSDGR